ncbi:MAG: IclR family transcriptional regulator [Notoacmeibacter sp.]|nr:IclR family transcriptional regulator [Notoacmeibacter sp.]
MENGVIKSAGRAMRILEALDAAGHDLRVSEIAKRLDIPQSSASLLIKSLSTMGFLDFDSKARTYRPSVRVAMLGTWVLGSETRTADLLNLMRKVSDETGQTVALVVQNGLRMRYVNTIESTETLRMIIHAGLSRPIHMAAAGIVLLALKKDDEIKRILTHSNAVNEDARHKAVEADVFKKIEFARENGYFLSDGLYTPNAGMIAMPLDLGPDRKPLAIGIGGFSKILLDNEASFLASLRNAVGEFAEGLEPVGKKPAGR